MNNYENNYEVQTLATTSCGSVDMQQLRRSGDFLIRVNPDGDCERHIREDLDMTYWDGPEIRGDGAFAVVAMPGACSVQHQTRVREALDAIHAGLQHTKVGDNLPEFVLQHLDEKRLQAVEDNPAIVMLGREIRHLKAAKNGLEVSKLTLEHVRGQMHNDAGLLGSDDLDERMKAIDDRIERISEAREAHIKGMMAVSELGYPVLDGNVLKQSIELGNLIGEISAYDEMLVEFANNNGDVSPELTEFLESSRIESILSMNTHPHTREVDTAAAERQIQELVDEIDTGYRVSVQDDGEQVKVSLTKLSVRKYREREPFDVRL